MEHLEHVAALDLMLAELESNPDSQLNEVPVEEVLEQTEDKEFWDRLAAKAIAEKGQVQRHNERLIRENRMLQEKVKLAGETILTADHFLMLRRSLKRAKDRAWYTHTTTSGAESSEAKGEFRAYSDALATLEDILNGRKIG